MLLQKSNDMLRLTFNLNRFRSICTCRFQHKKATVSTEELVPSSPYKSKIDLKLLPPRTVIEANTITLLERLSLVDCANQQGVEILEDAIAFADQIQQVDTKGIDPLVTVLEDRFSMQHFYTPSEKSSDTFLEQDDDDRSAFQEQSDQEPQSEPEPEPLNPYDLMKSLKILQSNQSKPETKSDETFSLQSQPKRYDNVVATDPSIQKSKVKPDMTRHPRLEEVMKLYESDPTCPQQVDFVAEKAPMKFKSNTTTTIPDERPERRDDSKPQSPTPTVLSKNSRRMYTKQSMDEKCDSSFSKRAEYSKNLKEQMKNKATAPSIKTPTQSYTLNYKRTPVILHDNKPCLEKITDSPLPLPSCSQRRSNRHLNTDTDDIRKKYPKLSYKKRKYILPDDDNNNNNTDDE